MDFCHVDMLHKYLLQLYRDITGHSQEELECLCKILHLVDEREWDELKGNDTKEDEYFLFSH